MKRLAIAMVCLLAAVPAGARAQSRSVTVSNFAFTPQQLVAAAGEEVTWTWASGSFTHNVTAEVGDSFASPSQSSGVFFATFHGGSVLYRCTIHSTFTAPFDCDGMCAVLTDDVTAPAPPGVDAPADNSSPSSRTVTFSGTAPPDATAVRLSEDGVLIEDVATSGGAWTFTTTFENGAHTVQARALDLAMNASTPATVHFTLAVDTDPPAATINVPFNLSVLSAGPVSFVGDAADDLAVDHVVLDITTLPTMATAHYDVGCTGCPARFVDWRKTITLGRGVYRARATAFDGTGKTGNSETITFVVV